LKTFPPLFPPLTINGGKVGAFCNANQATILSFFLFSLSLSLLPLSTCSSLLKFESE